MNLSGSRAFILLGHGARDARWSASLQALADRVQKLAPKSYVSCAFLEFQAPTLPDALHAAAEHGCDRVDVALVFWGGAGHVLNDVEPVLAAFRAARPDIELRTSPVLSELPGLLDFVAKAVTHADR